jgi:phage-related minor tail protein
MTRYLSSDDGGLSASIDKAAQSAHNLELGAGSLAHAMSTAFTQGVSGAKQLDDVLKSLALRVSSLALTQALKPVASGVLSGLNQLFTNLFPSANTGSAAAKALADQKLEPFAAGGVVATPSYFPLAGGGTGLAGEAGAEAIMPLARGADGRLGVAMNGGAGAANVTINIATPDTDGFRRSEAYLTSQIARAVARGQRSL